jgi:hypothetical protein
MPVIRQGGGKLIQSVSANSTTKSSTTASIPSDNTTPQDSEGTQFLSLSITPKRADSKLVITAVGQINTSGTTGDFSMALFVTGNANALSVATNRSLQEGGPLVLMADVSLGVTTSLTFSLRYGPDGSGGTAYLNQRASSTGPAGIKSFLLIEEVAP